MQVLGPVVNEQSSFSSPRSSLNRLLLLSPELVSSNLEVITHNKEVLSHLFKGRTQKSRRGAQKYEESGLELPNGDSQIIGCESWLFANSSGLRRHEFELRTLSTQKYGQNICNPLVHVKFQLIRCESWVLSLLSHDFALSHRIRALACDGVFSVHVGNVGPVVFTYWKFYQSRLRRSRIRYSFLFLCAVRCTTPDCPSRHKMFPIPRLCHSCSPSFKLRPQLQLQLRMPLQVQLQLQLRLQW